MTAGVNAEVDVEWRAGSANDPDGSTSYDSPDKSCTATDKNGDGTGTCTVSYVGLNKGKDEIIAWVDVDGSDATAEVDATEPHVPAADDPTEPDGTDRIGNWWFVGIEEG